jgi:hypothetical protein
VTSKVVTMSESGFNLSKSLISKNFLFGQKHS